MKALTASVRRKPKLAIFDVEGVLIPKNRMLLEIAKSMGITHLITVLFVGFLYEIGIMPLKSTLKRIFWVMRGANIELLYRALDKLPLMPSAIQVFATLKKEGCKTALVSSGLPTFLVEKLSAKLGADYAVGIEVGKKNQVLTGEVWGDATERNGKYLVLEKLMREDHITAADCVVIADDRNNASIFLKEALKIGYDPDFIIRIKADVVVTGKLSKILNIIHGESKIKSIPSQKDFVREAIHASGFLVPVFAIFLGIPLVALFVVAVTTLYSASELLRARGKNMPLFSSITRHAASQSELCEFTLAPVYFAVGILLTLLLIPAPASYAGIAIFALGDSTASLIGGTLSKKALPFNGAKTLEGTLSGFLFGFLGASLFVAPWIAIIGAAVGMIIEYLPLPLNDNLLIAFFTALVLMFIV